MGFIMNDIRRNTKVNYFNINKWVITVPSQQVLWLIYALFVLLSLKFEWPLLTTFHNVIIYILLLTLLPQ